MKPGFRSSEFWALLLAPFLPVLASVLESLAAPGAPLERSPYAPVVTSAAAAIYAIARTMIKARAVDSPDVPNAPAPVAAPAPPTEKAP